MIYGKIINLRNALYERGVFAAHALGAKTVSVGNITVGGTGKTPLVAFVAQVLAEKGEKVCILSRGYGRKNAKSRVLVADGENVLAKAEFAGDEPFELADKLRGKAFVIADANRVAAARWAIEKFNVTAFVLDDAFQHRRARRDLNIVCIDATNPFGNYKLLPFGILREPLENLRRADAIVITRANLSNEIEKLVNELSKYANCPIFPAANKISNVTELENFSARAEDRKLKVRNRAAFAFCALGNPENFFSQLKSEKFNVAATRKFPDHHFYTAKDAAEIEQAARAAGAEILLTTAKDAVKLKDFKFQTPCFVVETEMNFEDEKAFREMIERIVSSEFSRT